MKENKEILGWLIKDWEKIGDVSKPRFQNMYGKKNAKNIIWLDNFRKGNWAVILGKEISPSKYREEKIYANVSNKKDAKKVQQYYMSRGRYTNLAGLEKVV